MLAGASECLLCLVTAIVLCRCGVVLPFAILIVAARAKRKCYTTISSHKHRVSTTGTCLLLTQQQSGVESPGHGSQGSFPRGMYDCFCERNSCTVFGRTEQPASRNSIRGSITAVGAFDLQVVANRGRANQEQLAYEERNKIDANPSHFVHASRPIAHSRKSSGNFYAPNRAPSRSGLHDPSELKNDPNEMMPHRPAYVQRHSLRNSSFNKAAYRAQERAYVQKLQQEPDNEYYEAGLDQFQLGDEEEDDDDLDTSYPGAFDDLDSKFNMHNDDYLTSFCPSMEDDVSAQGNRERLEWLTMLASVLTGEVVKSEKKRISGAVGTTEGGKPIYEIWVGLRAKAAGRSEHDQRRIIEDARTAMDVTLDQITRFQVRRGDATSLSPPEQVAEILNKLEHSESMYPNLSEMIAAKPIVATAVFIKNVAALNAWTTVTTSIHNAINVLKKWTGNEALDVTEPQQVSSEGVPGINDESSFIERILKENGLQRTFEKKSLAVIDSLVSRAKATMIEHSVTFSSMHLPPYLDELLLLINFPTKLIEEALKLRLVYAKRLEDPTMLMVDQMIEDFVRLLNVAVDIKTQYINVTTPEEGWNLPPCIDENFDTVVLETMDFYFKLLNWKLGSNSKSNYFKEAEILESEYEFLNNISQLVEGGDIQVAEQFSALTNKLISRVSASFQAQLTGPTTKTGPEMQKHYSANYENVRLRHRKLLRFSKTLSSRFENSTEYALTSQRNWTMLVNNLAETGHFFAYTASVEHDGVYIIADPSLAERPDAIRAIMRTCAPQDLNLIDPVAQISSYVLIMSPPEALSWPGRVIEVNIPEPNLDIKTGKVRLVADGSRERLRNANLNFAAVSQDLVNVVVQQRANLPRVNRELTKITKVSYKLSNTIMESVALIRERVAGYGCEELIQNSFVFATEFGQRSLRFMDPSRRAQHNMKLMALALAWVSFVCDDCDPTDRKTFKWTVIALEFAMVMIRGKNILVLEEDSFTKLRAKVARCMTLLISHFDIMGARSAAQLERERLENSRNKKNNLYDADGQPNDQVSLLAIKNRLMQQLEELENKRKEHQEEHQMAGKVLDDTISENRSLMYLASSLSNITIRWQQGKFIGGGSFGNVYQGVNLDTGEVMAVKEIRLQDPQSISGIVKSIKDEMTVLEMLNHPNVVSYYGVEVHRDKVYIFMELCQGGSLASQLEHGRIAEETVIQVYTLQMLEGLAHLHERGIVHRDIKPENVLLDHNGIIKFVDFGAAKVIAKRGRTKAVAKTQVNSMTGTPMYMSPEIITGSDKGRQGAMDIWALGCCVLEMATAQRPWSNLDNEWAIMYHIAGGHAPAFPSHDQLSPAGQEFLERCFDRDPNTRPSAVTLLNDPWMIDIKQNTGMASPSTPSSDYTGTYSPRESYGTGSTLLSASSHSSFSNVPDSKDG